MQIYDPFNSLQFDLAGFIELLKVFNKNYSILLKHKSVSYHMRDGISLKLNTREEVKEKFDLILSIIDFEDANNQFFKEISEIKYKYIII